MTEDEFKKVMGKLICFITIALIVLIVIGFLVFNKSGKSTSIFKNQKEVEDYKRKVQEININTVTNSEEIEQENLENVTETENKIQ